MIDYVLRIGPQIDFTSASTRKAPIGRSRARLREVEDYYIEVEDSGSNGISMTFMMESTLL